MARRPGQREGSTVDTTPSDVGGSDDSDDGGDDDSDSPIDTSPEVGGDDDDGRTDVGGSDGGNSRSAAERERSSADIPAGDTDSDSGGGDPDRSPDPSEPQTPADREDATANPDRAAAREGSENGGEGDRSETSDRDPSEARTPADREDATANPGRAAGGDGAGTDEDDDSERRGLRERARSGAARAREAAAGAVAGAAERARSAIESDPVSEVMNRVEAEQQRDREAAALVGEVSGAVGPQRREDSGPDQMPSAAEQNELSGAAGVNVGEVRGRPPARERELAAAEGTQEARIIQDVREQLEEQGRDPGQFDIEVTGPRQDPDVEIRRDPSGQTALDETIEDAEAELGIDIPGEGDVVQQTEEELAERARAQREGAEGSVIPSPDQAARYARESAETTVVGDPTEAIEFAGQDVSREAGMQNLAEGTARRAAQTANVPAALIGAGRFAEGTGEFAVNAALGGLARGETGDAVDTVDTSAVGFDAYDEAAEADARAAEQLDETGGTLDQLQADTAESIEERPIQTAGSAAFEAGAIATEVGAPIIAERAVQSARTAVRARRWATVDFDDVSDPAVRGQSVGSPNPEFSEAALADTGTAVDEFSRRARDAPQEVTGRADGGAVVYHGTDEGFPDETTVGAGSSEIEGLYTAADTSPLRLSQESGGGLSSVRPRFPRFRDPRQIVATSPEDIRAVPDEAGGSRTPGEDLDQPVRNEAGEIIDREQGSVSQYLEDEADPGTAQVLPQGTRTPEQEAIIPRGTGLTDTGRRVGVRLDGDIIPARFFETDVDATGGAGDDVVGAAADAYRVGDDVPYSRVRRADERTPVAPVSPIAGSAGVSAAGLSFGASFGSYGYGSGAGGYGGSASRGVTDPVSQGLSEAYGGGSSGGGSGGPTGFDVWGGSYGGGSGGYGGSGGTGNPITPTDPTVPPTPPVPPVPPTDPTTRPEEEFDDEQLRREFEATFGLDEQRFENPIVSAEEFFF